MQTRTVRVASRYGAIGHELATIGLLLFMAACGGSPTAGPSPVAPPPVAMVAAPVAAQTVPAWLAPDLRGTLVLLDGEGRPKRWEGGPFHHCFAPDVDRATLERVADRMTALSGISRTEAGPCNVEWVVEETPAGTTATANLAGTSTAILHARVSFMTARASAQEGVARHEAGHVLGLGHSPRAGDLMVADYYDHTFGDFSRDEMAVLAWMYGR